MQNEIIEHTNAVIKPTITEISLQSNTVIRFVSDHHKDTNAESFQIHV